LKPISFLIRVYPCRSEERFSYLRLRITNTAKALLGSGVVLWIVAGIGYWRWKATLAAATVRSAPPDAASPYVTYEVPLWLRVVTLGAIVLLIAGAAAVVPGGSEKPAPRIDRR